MNLLLVFMALLCVGLTASVYVYGFKGDPFGLIRVVVRLLIVVPLGVFLSIGAVRLFDRYTPPVRWIDEVANNEVACAIVLSTLIFGVFWLCVQG